MPGLGAALEAAVRKNAVGENMAARQACMPLRLLQICFRRRLYLLAVAKCVASAEISAKYMFTRMLSKYYYGDFMTACKRRAIRHVKHQRAHRRRYMP